MSHSVFSVYLVLCAALSTLLLAGCDTSGAADDAFISFRLDERSIRATDVSGYTAGDLHGTYLVAMLPGDNEPLALSIGFDSTGVARFVHPTPSQPRNPVWVSYGHPTAAEGPAAQYRL